MKKKILILLCLILAIALSTACSSESENSAWGGTTSDGGAVEFDLAMSPQEPMAEPMPAPMAQTMLRDDALDMSAESAYRREDYVSGNDGGGFGSGAGMPITAPVTDGLAEKIIYSYYADIETLEFDETIENIYSLIAGHGAFIENSNVSGANYHSIQRGLVSYRYAHFQIRVPVEQLNAMTARLNTLGNITHQSSNATNITSQFVDTETRLNTLRVQEERLLAMLSKAEDIPDLITIESSIANVRYQIESLTSTLTNWQRQVDYSVLTLNINEVEEYQEVISLDRTYWERMADGFMATMRGIGNLFTGLFMWIVVSAPVLVILAIIVVAIIVIIKRSTRKAQEKRKAMPQSAARQYPPQYAPAPIGSPVQDSPAQEKPSQQSDSPAKD